MKLSPNQTLEPQSAISSAPHLNPSSIIAVFTGCGDGVVRAYEAKSAVLKRTYTGHEGAVNCLMIVRDKIFTGSSDCTMRVWDASDIR